MLASLYVGMLRPMPEAVDFARFACRGQQPKQNMRLPKLDVLRVRIPPVVARSGLLRSTIVVDYG